MEFCKAKLIETESRLVVTRDWRLGEKERYWSKGTNFQL